jgi:hypothetical protein
MDSMRSLNTSLPGTSPSKQHGTEPPEQLLQAFKAAALSVTKLYKTAAADQSRARSEGYQDALDELLVFLDREDIGLSDGEGWKIRRWATERLDGRDTVSQHAESDDDTEKQERGSSPVLERTQSATQLSTRTASPVRTESVTPIIPPPIFEQPTMLPPASTFTFRSSHPYPQDTDMNLSDLNLSDSRGQPLDATIVSHRSQSPSASITITRPSRSASRLNQTNRHNTRTPNSIGRGAGQKRKINLGEFFDIGNLGHGKDGFGGGGKRGRFA